MTRLLALALLLSAPLQDVPRRNPVDSSLERLWAERGVIPAPIAGDAEFLRRVRLDLTGHIPTVDEVRAFAADKDADKRSKLVDKLIASDEFIDFWSQRVTNALLGYARGIEYGTNRAGFAAWVRQQVVDDRGWDQIVSDLLTASGAGNKRPETAFLAQFLEVAEKGPRLKLEELTGKVSTAFLGIRLRCAQCHDHPFDRYTQEDFFGMVSFFQKTGPVQTEYRGNEGMQAGIKTHKQALDYKFEHWERALTPRFFDGPPPETENLRVEFTEMLTRHDQFARAFANRVWAYLFGRGIVDPYDDFSPKNRPVAAELLEELLARARGDKFSIRAIVRLVMTSDAYQRTSRASKDVDAAEQEKYFARSSLRPLTPEQLWNAIERATDLKNADIDLRLIRRLVGADPAGQEKTSYDMLKRWFLGMLVRTSNPDAPANLGQYSANVQQVLYAMNLNSPLWSGVRSKGSGRLDRLVLYQDDPDVIVRELYEATVGRLPSAAESKKCIDYAKPRGEKGWETVFWALLNADEFIFNH